MKIFNLVSSMLFVICAALQYNDPDPWLWMPLYLYSASICWMAFRGRFYPMACMAGATVYGLYAIYLFFTEDGVSDWLFKHDAANIAGSMKAATPWIEDTREFFGLCIMIAVLMTNYVHARKKLATKSNTP